MRMQFRFLVSAALLLAAFLTGISTVQARPVAEGAIPLNGSASGTLNDAAPTVWWQVTVPSDGKLVVSTSAAVNSNLTSLLWLYDRDGTTQIKSYNGDWGANTSVNMDNLMPGTYWVKVERWTGSGTYSISSAFTPTALPVEAEPNDTVEGAGAIPLNGSTTGHLGFYRDGYTDTTDWWTVTIPKDGKLMVETTADPADPGMQMLLWMYDLNGTVQIKSYNGDWGSHTTVNMDNLMPGTYWIKVERWTGHGSYTIRSTFTPSALAVEPEPNDSTGVALNLAPNGSATGHLGFYRDGYTDTTDWWKVTIPKDGKLMVETTADPADPGMQMLLWMYDRSGTVQIKGYNGDWGSHTTVNVDNLMPGTYWIKVERWTGHGSYTIRSTFTPSTLDVEAECNDSTGVALDLAPNGSAAAHLGFYRDGYTDTTDWWKITVPSDGKLLVTTDAAQPDSILAIILYLFDREGTREIRTYSGDWGKHTTLNYDNLKAGTYYLRASQWTGFGSYRITSSFTPVHYANDAEPNNTSEAAEGVSPLTTVTGHLGYFGADDLDGADYFSFTVPAGWDSLHVRVKADSTLTCKMHLLDSSGNVITWVWDPTTSIANPAAGKYYVYLSHWTGYGAYAFMVSHSWMDDVPVSGTGSMYPPSGLTASDVPGDQGHHIQLNWTLSPSESDGAVLKYRIFRSRTAQLTDPVAMSGYATVEDLNAGELTHTVLVDSVSAGCSQYTDSVPLNNTAYYYWVQAVGTQGASKMVAASPVITAVAETPQEFRVNAPYPNPFNPSVTIGYTLPERLQVRLTIYDSLGRMVTVLEDGIMDAGHHETVWNGRSSRGEILGSGMYLYRVEAGSHRVQGKMTLLR